MVMKLVFNRLMGSWTIGFTNSVRNNGKAIMSVRVEDVDGIQVAPLNKEELAWAKKLDALLGRMPARLKLIEVDDSLNLVDADALRAAGQDSNGFGAVRDAGAVLACLSNGTLKISGMTN